MLVQGVQAIANAAPATSGPPRPARRSSVSECHSRLNMPMNGVARKTRPIRMITTPPICSSSSLCVVQRRADHRRAHPEQDEDRREARDEQQARDEHAAGADALLQVRRRDADHGREVAGHERQHAGREERHEPGGERQRDADAGRGVGGGEDRQQRGSWPAAIGWCSCEHVDGVSRRRVSSARLSARPARRTALAQRASQLLQAVDWRAAAYGLARARSGGRRPSRRQPLAPRWRR